jgi:hypothetical protein
VRIAVGAVVEGIGPVLGKAAHDHGPVAERSERRENGDSSNDALRRSVQ